MNVYKNNDNHIFVQLDNELFQHDDFIPILIEHHNGDEDKHKPLITIQNTTVKVKIGHIMHPMTPEHHISMIFLKTKQGGQYKIFNCMETPIVTFELSQGDVPLEAYGYCNLHGLWKEMIENI